jgi:hypothetical protein
MKKIILSKIDLMIGKGMDEFDCFAIFITAMIYEKLIHSFSA